MSAPEGRLIGGAGPHDIAIASSVELDARAVAVASLLPGTLRRGTRVALLGATNVDAVAAVFAIRARGLCPVPIDSSFTLEETAFAINDSVARVVLVDPAEWATAEQLRVLTPYVEDWVLLIPATAHGAESLPTADDAMGSLHYTAAATGRPTAFHVPDPLVTAAGGRDVAALLGETELAHDSFLVLTTTLSDPAAIQLCVAGQAAGSWIALAHDATPSAILTTLAVRPGAVLQLSPATALAVAKALDEERTEAEPPGLVLIAAPGCPASVTHRLVEAWGPVVRQVYLAPGVGAVAAIAGVDVLVYPGSMGEPLRGTDAPRLRIRADDAGVGLIEAEQPPGSGAWTAWGDLGRLSRGRLFVVDRHQAEGAASSMPQAIESALAAHPWVADVAVVVRSSNARTPTVHAYVTPTPQADHDELVPTLRAELTGQFPAEWVPAWIEITTDLPRTATGKLDRRRLHAFGALGQSAPA